MELNEPMPDPEPAPEQALDTNQAARLMVLALVKPLLTSQSLASKTPPAVDDLIRLAAWVLDGTDDPPYPYTDDDGTVHLAIGVWLKPDGYLWMKGLLYQPVGEDSQDPET